MKRDENEKTASVQYERAGKRTLKEVLKIVESIEKKVKNFEKLNPLAASNSNEFIL